MTRAQPVGQAGVLNQMTLTDNRKSQNRPANTTSVVEASPLLQCIRQLSLRKGDRILLLRCADARHVRSLLQTMFQVCPEIDIDLVTQKTFEAPLTNHRVQPILIPEGPITPSHFSKQTLKQIKQRNYRLCLVPFSNELGQGYPNVFRALSRLAIFPCIGVGITGRLRRLGRFQLLSARCGEWLVARMTQIGGIFLEHLLAPISGQILRLVDRYWLRRANRFEEPERVMIYCPNTQGHRHIYAKRFADYFCAKRLDVVVILGRQNDPPETAPYFLTESVHLGELSESCRVYWLAPDGPDGHPNNGNELNRIVHLQQEMIADLTLIVDGDRLLATFLRQLVPGQPKLAPNTFAVFIQTEFFYPGAQRALRKTRIATPITWKESFLRSAFHRLLFKNLHLLDGGLYSDESFVAAVQQSHYLNLPEVGNARLSETMDDAKRRFHARIEKQLKAFLAEHPDREVILAFGDLEIRKGFGFLLRLVSERENLILIRCGRTKGAYWPDSDAIRYKEQLLIENRLFEVDAYLESQRLFDLLFGSVQYVLLPYREFFRTSAVMVQALSYRKPVLVPNVGLLATRVQKHNLGRVFVHQNYDSFLHEFDNLRTCLPDYIESTRRYYEAVHSDEAFQSRLDRIFFPNRVPGEP